MLPVFKRLCVDVSCIGNHDFDFGIKKMMELIKETGSPWLMANLFDKALGDKVPVGNSPGKHILESNGKKLGFIGLAEFEWITQFNFTITEEIIYEDFVECARRLVKELKEEDKCDYVIALTHMRVPNERKLAQEVGELDMILGGHDHIRICEIVNDVFLLKSGTDFEEFTDFEVWESEKAPKDIGSMKEYKSISKGLTYLVQKVSIDEAFEPDQAIQAHVKEYSDKLSKDLDIPIGFTAVELEGRFEYLRSQETNLSNFVADLMRYETGSEAAILNCGALRTNGIIDKGLITMRTVINLLPMVDNVVVMKLTGQTILEALENAVSQYPKLDGRWSAVSGITFSFHKDRPSFARIDSSDIKVNGEDLDLTRVYKVAVKYFISEGKDGFQVLKDKNSGYFTDYATSLDMISHVTLLFKKLEGECLDKTDDQLRVYGCDRSQRSEQGYIMVAPTLDGRLRIK